MNIKKNKGKQKEANKQDKFFDRGQELGNNKKEQEDEQILAKEDPENDTDIYTDSVDERLVEEDEMNPEDAGFMEGYGQPKLMQCRNKCGKDVDSEEPLVREFEEKEYYFCSEKCANEFEKHGHGRKN